ncbi:hypothetical protein [Tardiphaga sp. 839_C3_N1_4]|uniref:hypothetical protein n=1 Tax=Tardiphaga sp. 839_C3_N1_4 TaxID=3240761 RepID=UPI003F2616D9
MPLTSTVLFGVPQQEISNLLMDRIINSSTTSIVSGFVTPGGLAAISGPIKTRPRCLKTLVIGAATYPGFRALDELIAAGVPVNHLHVHLGHSAETGGRKNPFARYHPMLHSKIYYMEFRDGKASAFIGSHNMTSFALTGLNGEAAVMLEGPTNSPEFRKVRDHIDAARSQAVTYSPGMKEAYAWWAREFIDGLRAEIHLPQDWTVIRTILLFVSAARSNRPKPGDHIYFEIPAGIEQIESLKTETHLFLFDNLPSDPWEAIHDARSAVAQYNCKTLGAENRQGNRELTAHWRIEATPNPVLKSVPSAIYRPRTPNGMQQVRVEVSAANVEVFEYQFEREAKGWDPDYSHDHKVFPSQEIENEVALLEAQGDPKSPRAWKLVKGLIPRQGSAKEKDEAALMLASPDSGSFILVSLRRRRKDLFPQENDS